MRAAILKVALHLAAAGQIIVDDCRVLGVKLILSALLQNPFSFEQSLLPDLQIARAIILKRVDLFHGLLIQTSQQGEQLLCLLLLSRRAGFGLFDC